MRPSIRPFGVGDLKVVKHKLVRYEAGEVAHIENVLAREKRERVHRRLRQIEEIVTLSQEREEENRRDLQSTERFELENETQRTIKSESSFEAGIELSAGYGPVSLSVFGRFASRDAKEESDRTATKYAKEIIDRSLSRLVERVRQERQVRTLEETEETNTHGFDNTAGENNITGVYRWVDKHYRAKVVNYGKRLMYEFIVPEPAAFYLFATANNYENKVLPIKPTAPVVPGTSTPLTPSAITRTNYLTLVRQYGTQGVEPPPPQDVVVSKPIAREIPNGNVFWAFANEDLNIPRGYRANWGWYYVNYTWTSDFPSRSANIVIGDNVIKIGIYPSLPFDGETGKMPISGTGYGIRSFAINIEILCSLIPEHFQQWQLKTYGAIINAYNRMLMDYEERLAAAQIQQGGRIGGNNPLINREIEKEELKRACLVLWSGDALTNPAAITHISTAAPPGNYPEISRQNALTNAQKIEFFEEAFEWRNIVYEFYPYFWGRKTTWVDRNALESSDPVFAQFLKAGAARVMVPVRPSYTEAVLYYQLTGTIWSGGPVPALTTTGDPDAVLYNGYVQEMQGVQDVVDIDEDVDIPAGDPEAWMARVPTSLVWLQADDELPDLEMPGE